MADVPAPAPAHHRPAQGTQGTQGALAPLLSLLRSDETFSSLRDLRSVVVAVPGGSVKGSDVAIPLWAAGMLV